MGYTLQPASSDVEALRYVCVWEGGERVGRAFFIEYFPQAEFLLAHRRTLEKGLTRTHILSPSPPLFFPPSVGLASSPTPLLFPSLSLALILARARALSAFSLASHTHKRTHSHSRVQTEGER